MARALTAIGLCLALAAPAADAQDVARDAIEGVVRELLQREPELVIDAIQRYQAKQEQERTAATVAAIQNHRAAIESFEHPSAGPEDAAVTLVEFFDYRCGYCRRMLKPMATLKETQADVRVVYIDFPVLGPDSLRAAQASLAAWAQAPERYTEFHDALMSADDLSASAIEELADALGLDTARLVADMNGDAVRQRLENNYAIARAIGIEGTPAFIVGDTLLPGAVPLERLERVIADARGS